MSWIKDNKFLVALFGGTLVGAVALYVVGSKGAAKYDLAKTDYDAAAQEATGFERLPLYPKRENLDGKKKALDDYRNSAGSLQVAFDGFRPKELKNVSPEVFTNQLKTTHDEVRKAFEGAGTKVPDVFFCGFENYKTSLARGNTTGLLDYQLAGIKTLMLAMAGSGVTEIKNLHRPALAEEQGRAYESKPSEVARPLPLEISFQGPEKAVRSFLSAVVKPDGYYFVIRSLRVTNAKKDPPKAADAKFDKPVEAKPAGSAADLFSGFVLPSDVPEATPDASEGAPAPAPASADSSRVLAQVLGNEELQVFVRLDIMQFLPAKKLP